MNKPMNKSMNKSMNTTEILTEHGILRVWLSGNRWSWATPNGSQRIAADTFLDAVLAAFAAEGLDAADYGYKL